MQLQYFLQIVKLYLNIILDQKLKNKMCWCGCIH